MFIATWALAGLGAVIGSALGSGAGKPGLFGDALVGGVLGVVAAVLVLTKLQWLLAEDRRGALVGGIAGFDRRPDRRDASPHSHHTRSDLWVEQRRITSGGGGGTRLAAEFLSAQLKRDPLGSCPE